MRVVVDLPPTEVDVTIDQTDLCTMLAVMGCPADKIDMAQAMSQGESGCYADAIGDLDAVGPKWGPSIGLFQIRSLRHPPSFGGADSWRWAWALQRPTFNIEAMLAITNGASDWSKWTVFTTKAYEPFLGQRPKILMGGPHAGEWWR